MKLPRCRTVFQLMSLAICMLWWMQCSSFSDVLQLVSSTLTCIISLAHGCFCSFQ